MFLRVALHQARAAQFLPTAASICLVTLLVTTQGCGRTEEERPAGAEDSAAGIQGGGENLVFDLASEESGSAGVEEGPVLVPLQVADYDFSAVPEETEPNDKQEAASEMTRAGDQWVSRGRCVEREKDWFTFAVEDQPQLWLVEAIGENIHRMDYYSAVGWAKEAVKDRESSRWSIANLYLLPGQHWLRVEASSGDQEYTLRVISLGPPDPRAEREPNDDVSRAHLLRFGVPRSGLIFDEGDRDYYTFSVNNTDHVELTLVPPHDLAMRLTLWELSRNIAAFRVFRARSPEPGTTLRYRTLLPPGDYTTEVRAESGHSNTPYEIRLARLDPFDLPVDLEPNDEQIQAVVLPPDLTAVGTVGEFEDYDWYRLPTLTRDTPTTFRVVERPQESFSPSYFLKLYQSGENSQTKILEWSEEEGAYHGTLPAGLPLLMRLQGRGGYRLEVTFDGGPAPQPRPDPLPVTATLPSNSHVFAAYWHQGQRADLPLSLTNNGDQSLVISLDAESSHHQWSARPAESVVLLEPARQTVVPIRVMAPPDAWADRPIRITVRARGENGASRTAEAHIVARCGAPPVNPYVAWPVPEELLGGLNAAWFGFGARPATDDDSEGRKQLDLFDGFTPNDGGWSSTSLPATVTVDLAGAEPVLVAGLLLNPRTQYAPGEQAREFELSLSVDGRLFTPCFSGELTRFQTEQAFVLENPVEARFARLRVLSRQAAANNYVAIGEWKVVMPPGENPFGRLNLADPALGGHIIWSDPLIERSSTRAILSEEEEKPRLRMDGVNPNRWVIGFYNQRAPQIEELQWVQASGQSHTPSLSEVQVAVSVESPVGPWTALGTWTLDPSAGSTSIWKLQDKVWARYVRFSTSEPGEAGFWHLPETLRIFERPADDKYRSILGEWGHYSRSGIFEARGETGEPQDLRAEVDDNDSRRKAQALEPDVGYRGRVLVGEDVDWYRIEVPKRHNRLRLTVEGEPSLQVAIRIEDRDGNVVPLDRKGDISPKSLTLEVPAEPGGEYYVRIEEPPRSIALCWDNSASTTPFKPTLYQALPRFVASVQADREYVNLLPFQDGGGDFLLDEWTDQPYVLQRAINEYDRKDGSSQAEVALLTATRSLAKRVGTKAIVFLTDADSPSYGATKELWNALEEVWPRIFALELHRGEVSKHQNLMQSWASVNEGYYDFFRSNADLRVAFDRASCHLRRPALYVVTAGTRFEEPPGPGTIEVVTEEEALALNAVELILDASGSMLQRLEGRRRIDIAREVLVDLVENTIPSGTPLALRIFGHRTPDACQTDLEVPLTPLDPARTAPIIRRTEAKNLAKTPIGASLELVAEDLKGVEGKMVVILVTDGEETCDGDPRAAIQGLKDQGIDVRVNIVGFAIEDAALKDTFRAWADQGGGTYFDATSGEQLSEATRQALQPKFQVIDAGGEVVASGVTNGEPVLVPAGTYGIKVLTSPPSLFEGVRVLGEDAVRLKVGR
jgi:hypothetical protein